MKIIRCEQRSEEWFRVRAGIITSSNFKKIVTKNGEPSKQMDAYLNGLAAERMSGIIEDGFSSRIMDEGSRREEESRQVYGMERGVRAEKVGFCLHDSGLFGCSPDGLVGEAGGVELKNPLGKTQMERLLGDAKLPSDHYHQVQGSLFVTGREWWDWVSYYTGLPIVVVRVYPDIEFHKILEAALFEAAKIIEEKCNTVKRLAV